MASLELEKIKEMYDELAQNDNEMRVLVLCATDTTVISEKWKKIIKQFNIDTNLYTPYFLGDKLTDDPPYKINDNTFNLPKYYYSNSFDIIVSENCPFFAFKDEAMIDIRNLLKDDGKFISGNYIDALQHGGKFEKYFTISESIPYHFSNPKLKLNIYKKI